MHELDRRMERARFPGGPRLLQADQSGYVLPRVTRQQARLVETEREDGKSQVVRVGLEPCTGLNCYSIISLIIVLTNELTCMFVPTLFFAPGPFLVPAERRRAERRVPAFRVARSPGKNPGPGMRGRVVGSCSVDPRTQSCNLKILSSCPLATKER